VEERLHADAQELENRRSAKQEDCNSISSAPAPSVDSESKRICKSSVYFQGPQKDFLTRQKTFELAKQRRMALRAQHLETDYSFQPRISDTSRQLVNFNIDYIGETTEERIHRLSVKDVERRDHVRSALEKLHHSEYTFKPSVNFVSQMLAKGQSGETSLQADGAQDTAVHERLYRSTVGAKSSRASCDRENALEEECSFKPRVDAKSARRFAHVKARYSRSGEGVMANIREELERKEEQLRERRREIEDREQDECTFAPGTTKPHDELQRPVVVSGLDRFFELKEMARRQEKERLEREERVFRPELAGMRGGRGSGGGGGATIPEPFDLSRGFDERVDASRRHVLKELPMEYTFTPHTNESMNREIIRQILDSADHDGRT
jgi:hypothetical protein